MSDFVFLRLRKKTDKALVKRGGDVVFGVNDQLDQIKVDEVGILETGPHTGTNSKGESWHSGGLEAGPESRGDGEDRGHQGKGTTKIARVMGSGSQKHSPQRTHRGRIEEALKREREPGARGKDEAQCERNEVSA